MRLGFRSVDLRRERAAGASAKSTTALLPAKRNGAAGANALVAPASSPTSSVSEKPTAEQWAEYDHIVGG